MGIVSINHADDVRETRTVASDRNAVCAFFAGVYDAIRIWFHSRSDMSLVDRVGHGDKQRGLEGKDSHAGSRWRSESAVVRAAVSAIRAVVPAILRLGADDVADGAAGEAADQRAGCGRAFGATGEQRSGAGTDRGTGNRVGCARTEASRDREQSDRAGKRDRRGSHVSRGAEYGWML